MKGEGLRIEVVHGPDAGLVVESEADAITVGGAPDATLVLRDPAVAPVHVEITYAGGPFALVDRSGRDDVNVDGAPAREARLASYSFVELGSTVLRLQKTGGLYIPDSKAGVVIPAPGRAGLRFPDLSLQVADLGKQLDGSARLLLDDDLLLVIGGREPMGPGLSQDVMLVEIGAGKVHALPPLPGPNAYAAAARLADGRVLVAGGVHPSTLLLDTRTWSFSRAAPLGVQRNSGVMLALPDGRALMVGGMLQDGPRASGEVWDPARDTWTPLPPGRKHLYARAVRLSPRLALLVSQPSAREAPVATAVDLERLSFTSLPALPAGARGFMLAALPGERALLLPGDGGDPPRRAAIVVDPAASAVYPVTPRRLERRGGAAAALADGRVLVLSGESAPMGLYTAELYDPRTSTWRTLPPPREGMGGAAIFARSDGGAVVAGYQSVRLFSASVLG